MKEKALIIHNPDSGKKSKSKKLGAIVSSLSEVYETLLVSFSSAEERIDFLSQKGSEFTYWIVVGGDGTFNSIVNQVMAMEKKPILGYINFGTLGDVGRNIGAGEMLEESLEIIKSKKVKSIDVGYMEETGIRHYFVYCLAAGAYSDLSYTSSKGKKKRLGKFAYYFDSIKEAFKKNVLTYEYIDENLRKIGKSPFIMALNCQYMGGFRINKDAIIDDGKLEIYLTEESSFNGLTRYLPSIKEKPIVTDRFEISFPDPITFCLDGEPVEGKDIVIGVQYQSLPILTSF